MRPLFGLIAYHSIGKQWGCFQDHQLVVEPWYSWGSPELIAKVNQGRVLIGEIGLHPFLKGLTQRFPARVIGSSYIQHLDHYLVAWQGIERFQDLIGKRIGILSFGSCYLYFVRHMLQTYSINPDCEVELVPLGQSYGHIEKFTSRRIDAGFLVEPFVALSESTGHIQVLATVKDFLPHYQWGILFAHDELLERNPGLVRRAMPAFCQPYRAIQEEQEKMAALGAQVFHLKKDVVLRTILRGLATFELDGALDMKGLENCLRAQTELGEILPGLESSPMIHAL